MNTAKINETVTVACCDEAPFLVSGLGDVFGPELDEVRAALVAGLRIPNGHDAQLTVSLKDSVCMSV